MRLKGLKTEFYDKWLDPYQQSVIGDWIFIGTVFMVCLVGSIFGALPDLHQIVEMLPF